MTNNYQLMTVGAIADHLGVERHQVTYILRSRGMQPAARAGIIRLFDATAVEEIGRILEKIQQGPWVRGESVGAA